MKSILVCSATLASVLALSTASFGYPVADDEVRDSEVKTCGEVSYDTQGGSLVINDSVAVQAADPVLEEELLSEVASGPARLCLYGRWVRVNRLFRANDFEQDR